MQALKSLGSAAKSAIKSDTGQEVIGRAVRSAAIGGALGAGANTLRGGDAWEGAKRGAIMGGVGSLGKTAYGHREAGMNTIKTKINERKSRPRPASQSGGRGMNVSKAVDTLRRTASVSGQSSSIASRGLQSSRRMRRF